MLKTFNHYLSVYQKFVATSFTKAISFRSNFILLMLLDLVFIAATLLPASFIYDHIEKIGPWNKEQLMFFISYVIVIDNLQMTFFSEAFWEFSHDIKRGNLDFTLLKPISSIFCVFFRYARPSTMLTAIFCWGLLLHYASLLNFNITQYLLLPAFVIISTALRAQIEFIIATAMFYLTAGHGINFLRLQVQEFASWPNFIYQNITRKFFTFIIPALLYTSAPVHFLFDYHQFPLMLMLITAVFISNILLRIIWNYSLDRYNSASS